ncbi:MAG: hypothetical protein ACJ759_08030 [Thermoanaerobaculia bacterium]
MGFGSASRRQLLIRLGRAFGLALGLAALWPGSAPAASGAAAPQPASYYVRRLVVEGGSPVYGVEGGVIFARHPQGECSLPAAPRVKPLAAALGEGMSLHVEIGACPAGAPPPSVRCRLEVGDRTVSTAFEGWKGTISVPLPEHTLAYGLNLQCSLPNGDEVLDSILYLTYGKPLAIVSPPREDWYRLACAVGAGLTADRPESEALEEILHGLYDYGQRRWRYGYCTIGPEDIGCRFGLTEVPVSSPSLNVLSETLATCKWSALVEDDRLCNFTDCFGFSRIFDYISATMGIGGLEDQEVKGSRGKGFGAHGWLRSLDPAALGNLECGERELQCAFLFNVHDLRKRDGLSYDSTFGRVYTDLSELIATNILAVASSFLVILDRANACFVQGAPYGGFSPLREVSKSLLACPKAVDQKAGFAALPDAVLTVADVALESIAGDAKPELVRVDLTVEVRSPGSYTVTGFLSTDAGKDAPVVDRPSYDATAVRSQAEVPGTPGEHRVSLFFSGEELAGLRAAGPYRLHAAVLDREGIVAELHQELPRFSLAGLGERAARLGEISRPVRVVLPGQGPVLRVEVPIVVRDAGAFAVEARLSSGDRTLSYRGLRRELGSGEHRVTVEFPGEEVARGGLDGTYAVTVGLHVLDPATFEPLKPVDTARVESGPFRARDFRASGRGAARPPARVDRQLR